MQRCPLRDEVLGAGSSVFTVLCLAVLSAVVRDTALRGTALAVCLFAAKGTAQVIAAGVTWMGKEEDMAMLTAI